MTGSWYQRWPANMIPFGECGARCAESRCAQPEPRRSAKKAHESLPGFSELLRVFGSAPSSDRGGKRATSS